MKYKLGQELPINVRIGKVDETDTLLPYLVEVGDNVLWMSDDGMDRIKYAPAFPADRIEGELLKLSAMPPYFDRQMVILMLLCICMIAEVWARGSLYMGILVMWCAMTMLEKGETTIDGRRIDQ